MEDSDLIRKYPERSGENSITRTEDEIWVYDAVRSLHVRALTPHALNFELLNMYCT